MVLDGRQFGLARDLTRLHASGCGYWTGFPIIGALKRETCLLAPSYQTYLGRSPIATLINCALAEFGVDGRSSDTCLRS